MLIRKLIWLVWLIPATVITIAIARSYTDLKNYQQQVNLELKQLNNKIKANKQIAITSAQVQTKAATAVVEAVSAPPVAPVVQGAAAVITTPPVASNTPMAYIFEHESGGNQYAINPTSGACGLGQALPCAKLLASCALSDYSCQVQWFSNYALGRYGSWQAAEDFWINHSWW